MRLLTIMLFSVFACAAATTGFIAKKILKLSLIGKFPRYPGGYANAYGYRPVFGLRPGPLQGLPPPIFASYAGGIKRPIAVPQPYPVPISRPYPIPVDRPVLFPVQVPVPVRISDPIPVPVPHPVIIRKTVPVFISANNGGVHGEEYSYRQFLGER